MHVRASRARLASNVTQRRSNTADERGPGVPRRYRSEVVVFGEGQAAAAALTRDAFRKDVAAGRPGEELRARPPGLSADDL